MKMAKKNTKQFLNMEKRQHCKSHISKLKTNDDTEINDPKQKLITQICKQLCSIICPGLPYQETIELVNIVPIVDFITGLCSNTFDTIIKDPEHRLNRLIQFSGPSGYSLRRNRRFIVPKCKTDRFRNSFIIRSCIDNIYTQIFSPFIIFFNTFIFNVLSFYIHFISSIICKYAIQPSGCNVLVIKLSLYLSIYLTCHFSPMGLPRLLMKSCGRLSFSLVRLLTCGL